MEGEKKTERKIERTRTEKLGARTKEKRIDGNIAKKR